MNNNQRIAVAVSLVFIGLVLLFLMVEYGDGSGVRFGTRIITFYTEVWTPWDDETKKLIPSQAVTTHFGLYIRNGIHGILLGLITPLGLWAVAAYIALGSPRLPIEQNGVKHVAIENDWGKVHKFCFWGVSIFILVVFMFKLPFPGSILFFCGWFFASIFVGYRAKARGYDWLQWFNMAMILNPIFVMLFLYLCHRWCPSFLAWPARVQARREARLQARAQARAEAKKDPRWANLRA